MKHVRKRDEKLVTSELYGKLSRATLWVLVTFITLISYVAGVRPFINSSFGIYPLGLLDGILITILVAATFFYLWSKLSS
jgi:hypothetical protein